MTVSTATASGSAAFTSADVFTATAAVTTSNATASGSASHTSPTYTATAAVTVNTVTASAAGTFAGVGTFAATAAITVSSATCEGLARFIQISEELSSWMSRAVHLTNQIVDYLNTQEFGVSFTARRRVAPLVMTESSELDQVQVWVFIGTKARSRLTRSSWEHRWRPVITIQKKIHGTDEETQIRETDLLHDLVEQIELSLEDQDFDGFSLLSFAQDQEQEHFNPEAMRNFTVFAASIEPEYSD